MTYYSWKFNISSYQKSYPYSFIPIQDFSHFPFVFYPNFRFSIYNQTPSNSIKNEVSKPVKQEVKKEINYNDKNHFDKMLSFVLKLEGGYTSNDCGQAGNKGIRQSTYDSYRKRKGLNTQSVKFITDKEVRDIYYNDYFVASGANRIQNPKLAMYVFDTAVNMGVGASKKIITKSGNDLDKFEALRLARYESIANNKPETHGKYLQGWKNRVYNLENFVNREFIA